MVSIFRRFGYFVVLSVGLGSVAVAYGQTEVSLFDNASIDDGALSVCNAGLLHLNSASGKGDFLVAEEMDWKGQKEHARPVSVHAGQASFAQIFSDTESYDHQLTKLKFNFGSEVHGAEYFVDICYRAPQMSTSASQMLWCHDPDGSSKTDHQELTLLLTAAEIEEHLKHGQHDDHPGPCLDEDQARGKRLICHVPEQNPLKASSIFADSNVAQIHLQRHERDYEGACKVPREIVIDTLTQLTAVNSRAGDPYLSAANLQVRAELQCETVAGTVLSSASVRETPLVSGTVGLLGKSFARSVQDPIATCRLRYRLREASRTARSWKLSPALITLFAKFNIQVSY